MDEETEKIRIAQIVGKWVGGGVENFLMNYYRNIDKSKIQFDFIIDSDSTVIPRDEIEGLGGKIIEIPPYQKIFKYTKELKKVLKENNYQIVHSHLNSLSVFPLYCAWKEKIPVRIAHSHSTTNKKEWKKNILKNILKPFSKIFATNYFACSEHAGRWLFGNQTFEKGKVTIIHNAIDVEKFKFKQEIRDNIRKKFKFKEQLVLGHVGRFVKQKNHEFLIDIFNEVQKENENSVLILIGEGPLEDKIKEKVKKIGLEKKVYFLGIRDDVNELMQMIDCFVFPSLYEGLGIVLIEAQTSNLPCIASTEIPKEVKINENVSFCRLNKNPKDWSNEILKLVNKEEQRISKEDIISLSKYNIKVEVNKLLEIYLKLEGNEK